MKLFIKFTAIWQVVLLIIAFSGCNHEHPQNSGFNKDISFYVMEPGIELDRDSFRFIIPNYYYDSFTVQISANIRIRSRSIDTVLMGNSATHWEIDTSWLALYNISLRKQAENISYSPDGSNERAIVREDLVISRINKYAPISCRLQYIPVTFYSKVKDKSGDTLLYNDARALNLRFNKHMQLEVDYALLSNALIDSLKYWNINHDSSRDWSFIDTLFDNLQYYFGDRIKIIRQDIMENWTFVPGSDTTNEQYGGIIGDPGDSTPDSLYAYSLGCHNSAETFRQHLNENDTLKVGIWSSHLIFVDSLHAPTIIYPDTYWISGKSLRTNGNFSIKWPNSNGNVYYNNFSYVNVYQLFWVLYNHNHNDSTWTNDSLIQFNIKFIKALAVLSAHELGHNTGDLEDEPWSNTIMDANSMSLSDIDSYFGHRFSYSDSMRLIDSAQFYFVPFEYKKRGKK